MWRELLTLLTCTFIKYVSSKQREWRWSYSPSLPVLFCCIFGARGPHQISHSYENDDFSSPSWQPEITHLPVPAVNKLLLQSVTSWSLSPLEEWRTVTSATLLMDKSLLFHHTCQSSLPVAFERLAEVYENVPTGRREGFNVLRKDTEAERRCLVAVK